MSIICNVQKRKKHKCIASKISLTKNKKKTEKEKEHTINRWTNVLFSCPIRCTRLTAWASAAGLSSGSTRTTCCASKRLSPLAPCWIKSSNTWTDFVSCCCLWVLLGLLFYALAKGSHKNKSKGSKLYHLYLCHYSLTVFFKKYFFNSNYYLFLKCTNIKINFYKIKNIILIYF